MGQVSLVAAVPPACEMILTEPEGEGASGRRTSNEPDPFESWGETWFGWWREDGYDPRHGSQPLRRPYAWAPSIFRFIDVEWDYPHKDEIARYLRGGAVMTQFARGYRCVFGGWPCMERECALGRDRSGYRDATDGVFAWKEDLAHYVRLHCIRLPDRMLRHIEARSFNPGTREFTKDDATMIAGLYPPGALVNANGFSPRPDLTLRDPTVQRLEFRGRFGLAELLDRFGRRALRWSEVKRRSLDEARRRGHPGHEYVRVMPYGAVYFAYVPRAPGWTGCEVFFSRKTGEVLKVNGPWQLPAQS